jgi:hypothetical protein
LIDVVVLSQAAHVDETGIPCAEVVFHVLAGQPRLQVL